jgi:hypothetical protein
MSTFRLLQEQYEVLLKILHLIYHRTQQSWHSRIDHFCAFSCLQAPWL